MTNQFFKILRSSTVPPKGIPLGKGVPFSEGIPMAGRVIDKYSYEIQSPQNILIIYYHCINNIIKRQAGYSWEHQDNTGI